MLRNVCHHQNKNTLSIIVFAGAMALAQSGLALSPPAKSSDWPQWLGPNRDGLSSETGILKSWPESGPKEVWRSKVGDGYSAIVVASGKLYTLYATGSEELLVSRDAKTGQENWRFTVDGSVWLDNWGNGPRSTPTVEDNMVFALGAKGQLHAVNATTGKKVWRHNLKDEYGAKIPTWGIATSPLVYDDLVIVDVGGKNGNGVMAFDKKSGDVAWRLKTNGPGYSAPVAVTVNNVTQILAFTGTSLVSMSPKDGTQYWSYPWRTDYDVNAATPIFVSPDRVFISSGYGKGSALLQVKGGENITATEVWKSRVMRNHFGTSLFVDGYLYGFDESTLKCVDISSHETKWAKRGLGKGSLIFADGHLIVLSDKGNLILVEATPSEYVEKASAQVLRGRCWTVPTLANGHLFVRNQKEMACFKLTSESAL